MDASSNDLLADRRLAWAEACSRDGDHAGAADLLEQVVARVPAWAPGWAALALAQESLGDLAAARAAWRRVATLDAGGGLGAAPHLARLESRTPDGLPDGYVRALFDDYAPRFDRHLVDALHYRGPAVLMEALERAAPGRAFGRALDLGCGTGLMGVALRNRAARTDGVDLSPAMADRARATGAYAEVAAGSLDEALAAGAAGSLDLVVAADVLVYRGDLAPVLAGAARVMAPGGLLAFTVQELGEGERYILGADMRFSHGARYVDGALRDAGLAPLLLERTSTRRERGIDVPGLVAVAAR